MGRSMTNAIFMTIAVTAMTGGSGANFSNVNSFNSKQPHFDFNADKSGVHKAKKRKKKLKKSKKK